ncbi:MAG: class B sortase [Lachnospiraceae bacterium]
MADKDYSVRGRSFRTAKDYQAALRDQQKIQTVEKKYEMLDGPGRERLMEVLRQGKMKFETLLGDDFIDELEEKHRENSAPKRKKATRARKKPQIKKKSSIKLNKGKKQKASKKLEDYDANMQQQIRYEMVRQEQKRKRMVAICSLVAFFCIGYVVFYYYLYEKNSAQYERLAALKEEAVESGGGKVKINYTNEEEKELVILEQYKKLYSQNKSLIGWLKIDDTNIDYPVMQTVNNEYYLDHNYTQEYDKNGSIFLDKDCDITNPSTNMIIYGHHMKSGKMFGKLDLYSSRKYYEDHKYIQFDTIYEQGIYEIMYVFRSRIYNEDEIVFKYYQFFEAATPEEFDATMREMANISLYDTGVTATYGDKLITLSTCDHAEEDGRFVVVAKKVN